MRPFATVLLGSLLVAGCAPALPMTRASAGAPAAPPTAVGASGTAMPPAAPIADASRPLALRRGSTWTCAFPPEADTDQIDQAVATVRVTVGVDGRALAASVVGDPGHGFGRAAAACALDRRYQPALDRSGSPIVATATVNVRFARPAPDER